MTPQNPTPQPPVSEPYYDDAVKSLRNDSPRIVTVLIEYSEERSRVTVRGVWPGKDMLAKPPLLKGNLQNYVQVFEGVDHKWNVGFDGLTPSQPAKTKGEEL